MHRSEKCTIITDNYGGKTSKKKEACWDFFHWDWDFFHWFPGLENFACELEICIFLPGYFLLIYSRNSDKMEIHTI